MEISRLLETLPKLTELNITYTELFKMKKKICEVFKNAPYNLYWQNKVTDEEHQKKGKKSKNATAKN